MKTKTEATQLTTRLPQEIRDWLQHQAQQNFSSINSEIVRAVRARMEAEQAIR
jgi:hypothetical protein